MRNRFFDFMIFLLLMTAAFSGFMATWHADTGKFDLRYGFDSIQLLLLVIALSVWRTP